MLSFRKATPNYLDLLMHWDEQPHVVASDPNDDWDWANELAREPEWRKLLIAEWSGTAIGFVQIIDPEREETHYWGEVGPDKRAIDIWIGEAGMLGRGYGTLMMKHALGLCFADRSVEEVVIDPLESNAGAIRFYERLGFRFVETRRFGADLCGVYAMSRAEWEAVNKER